MKTTSFKFLELSLLFLFFALLSGGAPASAEEGGSPLDKFDKEEREKLLKGGPVFQHVKKENEEGEIEGYGQAVIILNKPVDKSFEIFRQFDKHHLYFPRKKKSEIIKSWDNKALVHKVFGFYLVDIEYTVLYTADLDNHRVDYKLDKSHPHDLKEVEGFFQFEKIDENRTLFTYAATKVETGISVPDFIQEYLTSKDLPQVAKSVKKRVESDGKWTKD